MAKERVTNYRNVGTAEKPVWEKWFQITVADAVLMSDADGEDETIVDYVNKKINDLIGGAPGTFDTLKEIADYIASHEEVAEALNQAITNKADKNHTHTAATQSAGGFMAPTDKKKLDGVASGATKNDTLYKNQTPSTVAVGGVPKGYVPPTSGVEAIEMINKMLHDYVAPQVSASAVPENGGVFEIGTSKQVTAVNVNITLELKEEDLLQRYDLAEQLEKACNRKVWLNCGGFITIDKTEALTAIDVNSAKYTGKQDVGETILKVNKEASKEIAKQLRLRDIGGIIIIDYIDMKSEEDRKIIIEELEEYLKQDRSKTQILGFTKLNLLEMTRKHICSNYQIEKGEEE